MKKGFFSFLLLVLFAIYPGTSAFAPPPLPTPVTTPIDNDIALLVILTASFGAFTLYRKKKISLK